MNPHLLTRLSLLCLIVLCSFLPLAAEEHPWVMSTPFEQGTIHYSLSGTEQGTETLYIKEHGAYRAVHRTTSMSMMGMEVQSATIELTTPEWITTYNLSDQEATKITNPAKIYSEAYASLTPQERQNVLNNSKEVGTAMMTMGGTTSPNADSMLGYSCDRTEIAGVSTILTIHQTDIPLRSETAVMGMRTTMTATAIDTTSAIPASAFTGPEQIEVIHDRKADSMMRQMINSIITTLKEPDGASRLQNQPLTAFPTGPAFLPSGETPAAPDQTQQDQEQMMKEMEQGLQMLKGLFNE